MSLELMNQAIAAKQAELDAAQAALAANPDNPALQDLVNRLQAELDGMIYMRLLLYGV